MLSSLVISVFDTQAWKSIRQQVTGLIVHALKSLCTKWSAAPELFGTVVVVPCLNEVWSLGGCLDVILARKWDCHMFDMILGDTLNLSKHISGEHLSCCLRSPIWRWIKHYLNNSLVQSGKCYSSFFLQMRFFGAIYSNMHRSGVPNNKFTSSVLGFNCWSIGRTGTTFICFVYYDTVTSIQNLVSYLGNKISHQTSKVEDGALLFVWPTKFNFIFPILRL